ncbi:serine/threonine protein kinase [Streptomyces leeuwenhoekii]|uniref:Serine/threonine protein kinase n=1 Tax=Streptomyces leeuwenhoekii TaxID=1437453 RepID=A0ABR5I0F2_STRLW|nr:serine/threonine-protein kinase [Streptomyces leeuwenhoekii]KMS79824.1 serine/threonine protein kinase [Streptomyces leeuwenhoekii]
MAAAHNAGASTEAELPQYAGHYRLESVLGSGGMGVVHLARSTSGRKLAVKVVHAEFAEDPEFRGRFRQEVAAARRVSGAFTAPVVDADPEAGRPWMATLFIPGETLSEHVKRNGPMEPAPLRRLMAGLAEALRDIHRVGVVHRDLKPSNVLLSADGPKVIDFGISRPSDSELRTETGKLIGTPPFMAPEQFRRPREVGPAADVFALGSVLVHAATGRGPFDSDSPYVVAYQVVHDEPDLTGVPGELAALVRRCLAKEPGERPTPDQLMRELRSVASSYDTQPFVPAPRSGADGAPDAGPGTEADGTPRPGPGTEADGTPGPGPGKGAEGAPGQGAGAGEGGPRRTGRPGKRAVLVTGALGLAVLGTLVSVPLLDSSTAASGSPAPRSTAGRFGAWTAVPASGWGAPQCAYGAGKLLCSRPGLVFALDPVDGTVLWRHAVSRAPRGGPPVVAGGLVQPSPDGGRGLEALDPASGRPVWRRDVPEYGGLRIAGGTLLLTGADGRVTGVDGASGDTLWSRPVPGHATPYFDSFAGDPLAYATSVSADGARTRVTAVDPDTGEVRWDARLAGRLKPVGARNGSLVLLAVGAVQGETRAVVRYAPGTGEVRRVALPVPLEQAHGTVRGDVVYLTGAGGSLVAVDLAARRQRWSLETGVARASAPVADGRHVYLTAPDGRLLAVDARDGRLAGQTAPRLGAGSDRVPASLPEPVLALGHVYGAAPDGTVFAVDGDDPSAW